MFNSTKIVLKSKKVKNFLFCKKSVIEKMIFLNEIFYLWMIVKLDLNFEWNQMNNCGVMKKNIVKVGKRANQRPVGAESKRVCVLYKTSVCTRKNKTNQFCSSCVAHSKLAPIFLNPASYLDNPILLIGRQLIALLTFTPRTLPDRFMSCNEEDQKHFCTSKIFAKIKSNFCNLWKIVCCKNENLVYWHFWGTV